MLAKIHCAAVQGIAAHAVEVEVNDGGLRQPSLLSLSKRSARE